MKQTLPSLSMGDHPHLGFDSTPTDQVVSRPSWGHTGSSGVVMKNSQS